MTEYDKKSLLVLCGAGVGRSAMFAAFMEYYCGRNRKVVNAGLADYSMAYPNGPHPNVVLAMAEKDICVSDRPVQKVTTAMILDAFVIMAVCAPQNLPREVQEHPFVFVKEVADPPPDSISEIRKARDILELYAMGISVQAQLSRLGHDPGESLMMPFVRYCLQPNGSFEPKRQLR
jgi:protein-tyrosine-phosphatase